jgi:hypothetical protein
VAEQVFRNANLEFSKHYLPEIEGFVFKVISGGQSVFVE